MSAQKSIHQHIPGRSYRGELPPLTEDEISRAARLRQDVVTHAFDIGERNTGNPVNLANAAEYLEARFLGLGYAVHRETFMAGGVSVANIVAEKKGRAQPEEIVIVGAHYDAPPGSPGANDNASGVAGLLEIAYGHKDASQRTLRCVAFVNEEPPYFHTELMGSRVHARGCRERRDKIKAMLCLECLGCYNDRPGSQIYLPPLGRWYPDRADFIAFCSNLRSYPLLRTATRVFRTTTKFPSERLVAGIGWSDHWSFWRERYRAIMITDTAFLRNRHYHLATDLPETLDYERMAQVVGGIQRITDYLLR